MSKATWLVNAGCCALLLWGGLAFSRNWKAFGAEHQVSLLKNSPDRAVVKSAAASPAPVTPAWTDILSRNPFSFDRNDIDIAPAAPPAPRPAPPKPVLFGTSNTGTGPVAMLGDPGSRSSSQNVKVGEQFKGWTVVKIDKRSVVVENNGVEEPLVMGIVPIDRDGGKTAVGPSAPTVVTTTSPPPAPVPAANSAPPAATPAGTVMMDTPFGPQPVKQ
jgi:hypothetical protein